MHRNNLDDPTANFDTMATPEARLRIGPAHGSIPVEPRTAVVPVPRLVSHTGPARRAGREPPANVIDAARRSRQRWHCTHLDEHRAIASGKR